MRRVALVLWTFLAVTALLLVPKSDAQLDLAKSLIGKWAGEVQLRGVGDPNRTLIIESVTQTEGKWIAEGKYGVTGKGLGRVQIEVDAGGGKPSIRFATGANSKVRLELFDEKHLIGKLTLSGTSQYGNDRPMKLERAE